MPTTAYQSPRGITFGFIQINDNDPVYFNKVKAIFDELDALPLGQQLLNDINMRGKNLIITPSVGGSNMCTSGGDSIFYRLRAAFRGANNISARTELGNALMGAATNGWTLEKIGATLAGGMSPATVRTMNNLVTQKITMTGGARQLVGNQIATMIEAVADGAQHYRILFTSPSGTPGVGDDLVRFLRPWLKAGTGAGSKINFNPDGLMGCMGDKMKKRPPAIGLAHELCHAWRNAMGERLFDDALSCGLDDDEIMTTGFPPYQYEKYSENLFRAAWGINLPIRVNYR